MNKIPATLIAVACLLFAVAACAEDYISREQPFSKDKLTAGTSALGVKSQWSGGSLLDPSRFSMHQSYSMSYMTNGSQGDMTGLYMNRMEYRFAVPVTLQVDLGFFHKPLALAGRESLPGAQNGVVTIPRVGLYYQPTKNLFMAFEYINIPSGYGNMFGSMDPDYFFYPNPRFGDPNPHK